MRRRLMALPLVCLGLAIAPASGAALSPTWGEEDIGAPAAWSLSTGAGVKVAVVDTGVDASHEDLLGRVDPFAGWGFDGTTADSNGHGTAVAGIIAADAGNGVGIVGVAPDATIVPFRSFVDASAPPSDQVLEGLDRAGASGARVVNASFASDPYLRGVPPADRSAIENVLARHPNTLFVTAAGNDGTDNDVDPTLPCNADVANLICVGAYTPSHQTWSQSNVGETTVDILAPGTGMKTLTADGGYTFTNVGTSISAAYISGEAALLYSRAPQLTPAQVIALILGTTKHVDAFTNDSVSEGQPDAYAAVEAAIADADGDGVPDRFDACPTQANATADGCPAPPHPTPTPTPTATPTVHPYASPTPTPAPPATEPVPSVKISAKVRSCKTVQRCKRSATVKVVPDRAAAVSLHVDYQQCDKRRRCHWKRVLTQAVAASPRGKSVVVRGSHRSSLKRGYYRVVAVPSSRAGTGKAVTITFRVR